MTQLFPTVQRLVILCGVILLATGFAGSATAGDGEKEPTTREQVLGLEAMCAENAEAMAARQSEESLYERLGGEEKIHEIVVEIVRLHGINPVIKHTLEGVDEERLIHGVTQFLVAGSGGPAEYKGRSMVDAHSHLNLTNAEFLAAGSDVMQGMKNKNCGEAEIQEVVCVLVSLREQVVIDADKEIH